ncbi:MAG: hypothetical protein GY816_22455 [Cytophagales bacterium]|nr:hypothetical protein [Cytophagales bacterium]
MLGDQAAPNDTVLYLAGFENDPRPTFAGMVEWPLKGKSSFHIGLSVSTFRTTTIINAVTSSSVFPTGALYRYKYFDLGLPILLKYRVKKNLRVIAGIHFHELIGANQQNPERLYPDDHRDSFEIYGNTIKNNLRRTYVLGRYGIEVGLFKNRYVLYVVAERSLTNLMRNQNLAIKTPTALNYRSIGVGLQYRFRGKIE